MWFVLKDQVLYMYKASEDVVALDGLPVLGYELQFVDVSEPLVSLCIFV
jgi:FYVE/RhoGEF/PH domain-containing protein 5/6